MCIRFRCPKGEYLADYSYSEDKKKCVSCRYSCDECESYEQCTKCDSTHKLENGKCEYVSQSIWSLLAIIFGVIFLVFLTLGIFIAWIDGKFDNCFKKGNKKEVIDISRGDDIREDDDEKKENTNLAGFGSFLSSKKDDRDEPDK